MELYSNTFHMQETAKYSMVIDTFKCLEKNVRLFKVKATKSTKSKEMKLEESNLRSQSMIQLKMIYLQRRATFLYLRSFHLQLRMTTCQAIAQIWGGMFTSCLCNIVCVLCRVIPWCEGAPGDHMRM